jgi:hypothetical protein
MKRSTVKRYIHTLTRRVSFLEARITETENRNHVADRDKAELSALNYAVGLMRVEHDHWGEDAGDGLYLVKLTDEQVCTIMHSLRLDYRHMDELGALPLAVEVKQEIQDVYVALNQQTGVSLTKER